MKIDFLKTQYFWGVIDVQKQEIVYKEINWTGDSEISKKRIRDDPFFYYTFNRSCPDGKLNPPLSHGLQWNRIILACYQLNYEG